MGDTGYSLLHGLPDGPHFRTFFQAISREVGGSKEEYDMDLLGKPKLLALGVVGILVLLIVIYILIRPAFVDRDLVIEKRLENEVAQKDREIRRLGNENRRLQEVNTDLEVRIAEIQRESEGGLAVEETRKAVSEWEARLNALSDELDRRESDIAASEKALEDERRALEAERNQFLEENRQDLIDMGSAKQMKNAYEDLQQQNDELKEERRIAENRANNWLKAIYGGMAIIVLLIVATLILYFKNRGQKDNIYRTISSIENAPGLTEEQKTLLIQNLDRPKALPPHRRPMEKENEQV